MFIRRSKNFRFSVIGIRLSVIAEHRTPKTEHRNKAFTLIELLVVLCIVAVIGAAVLSLFASGVSIFQRVKDFGAEETLALLSLEEFERDLRNTFIISGINFTGHPKEIIFAGLVKTDNPRESQSSQEVQSMSVGQIRYYFDDNLKCLIKEEMCWADVVTKDPEASPAVKNLAWLKNAVFSYCLFNDITLKYEWKSDWNPEEGLPRAVNIEIEFSNGAKNVKVDRIVFMPIAE